MTKYPKAGVIIGDDRNEYSLISLLQSVPKLKQIVTLPTRKDKILSVILTNLGQFYCEPVIHPPVSPDLPGYAPSDHSVPVAYPLSNVNPVCHNNFNVRMRRPLPESGIQIFGKWITNEGWEQISSEPSPTEQAKCIEEIFMKKLDEIFPQKSVQLSLSALPFFTSDL